MELPVCQNGKDPDLWQRNFTLTSSGFLALSDQGARRLRVIQGLQAQLRETERRTWTAGFPFLAILCLGI
jgi:hypothetical protein